MKTEVIEAAGTELPMVFGLPTVEPENTVTTSSWTVAAEGGIAEFPQVLQAITGLAEARIGSSGLISTNQEVRATAGLARSSVSRAEAIAICDPQSIHAVGETGEHRLIWDQAARTVSFTASAQTGLHGLGISGEGAVVEITLPRLDATDVKLERRHEIEIETLAVDYLFYTLEVGG